MSVSKARAALEEEAASADERPSQPGEILIYHPGYVGPEQWEPGPLLRLEGNDSKTGAIAFQIAFTACAIVSDNRFDGWLSTGLKPTDPRVPEQRLLEAGKYWFHVPNPDGVSEKPYCYPVVAHFRAWRFPGDTPSLWQTYTTFLQSPPKVTQTAIKCHIIPIKEWDWISRNVEASKGDPKGQSFADWLEDLKRKQRKSPREQKKLESKRVVDHEMNSLEVPSDLYQAWRDKSFTFIPKEFPDGQKVVLHAFSDNPEIVKRYHNKAIVDQGVSREFLLARFAWCLFPSAISQFLESLDQALLIYFDVKKMDILGGVFSWEQCLYFAHDQCRNILKQNSKVEDNDFSDDEEASRNGSSASTAARECLGKRKRDISSSCSSDIQPPRKSILRVEGEGQVRARKRVSIDSQPDIRWFSERKSHSLFSFKGHGSDNSESLAEPSPDKIKCDASTSSGSSAEAIAEMDLEEAPEVRTRPRKRVKVNREGSPISLLPSAMEYGFYPFSSNKDEGYEGDAFKGQSGRYPGKRNLNVSVRSDSIRDPFKEIDLWKEPEEWTQRPRTRVASNRRTKTRFFDPAVDHGSLPPGEDECYDSTRCKDMAGQCPSKRERGMPVSCGSYPQAAHEADLGTEETEIPSLAHTMGCYH